MNSTTTNQDGNASIRVTADNMMRRVLRIQDPSDPREVAQGLGRAYPTESAELDEEIRGLPVAPSTPSSSYQVMAAPSMTGQELAYAQDNIRRDLDFLAGSSQLKEVEVELQGWGETIRTWLADGANAAGQALDPSARDRVFSARRILLDYSRVARLVGAMTPGLSIAYRRFSRSLDEASGLLLVSLGENLAQVGFSGDRLLLQAPASELSARAETAVSALRNLVGSASNGFSPSAWPWGSDAYRKLLTEIESGGHGDIRVLLQENGLRAFTDELINRAASVTGDGLRTLAATHGVALNRVERLVLVAQPFAADAPPLAAFLSALRLFVESFAGGTTTRLIAIGRPLLSAAWVYNFGGIEPRTRRLTDLIRSRAAAAQLHDNLFGVQLTAGDAQALFQLDNCLYALDLAIDLYAVGLDATDVRVEQRASVYGLVVWQFLAQAGGIRALIKGSNNLVLSNGPGHVEKTLKRIIERLSANTYDTDDLSEPPAALGLAQPIQEALGRELTQLDGSRQRLQMLADAMSPGVFRAHSIIGPVQDGLEGVAIAIAQPAVIDAYDTEPPIPPPLETSAARGVANLAGIETSTADGAATLAGIEASAADSAARLAGIENSAANAVNQLARSGPVIDAVTIDEKRVGAVIDGSGFVNVVAVLFTENGDPLRACQIDASAPTQLEITLPRRTLAKRTGNGVWEISVATATGAARISGTY